MLKRLSSKTIVTIFYIQLSFFTEKKKVIVLLVWLIHTLYKLQHFKKKSSYLFKRLSISKKKKKRQESILSIVTMEKNWPNAGTQKSMILAQSWEVINCFTFSFLFYQSLMQKLFVLFGKTQLRDLKYLTVTNQEACQKKKKKTKTKQKTRQRNSVKEKKRSKVSGWVTNF